MNNMVALSSNGHYESAAADKILTPHVVCHAASPGSVFMIVAAGCSADYD